MDLFSHALWPLRRSRIAGRRLRQETLGSSGEMGDGVGGPGTLARELEPIASSEARIEIRREHERFNRRRGKSMVGREV